MWGSDDVDGPTDLKHTHSLSHVPSRLYDEEYFLTACEGHDHFSRGVTSGSISPRLFAALSLVDVRPGERILDIGCGRGEAALCCAHKGAVVYGIDYSAAAMRIAQRSLPAQRPVLGKQVCLLQGDARRLPFEADWFDKLLMLDLVEHLYPWELRQALREARRVLISGGQVIIHTAPNRWYYQFGYPLYRLFEQLRGRRLPRDPRDRFPYHHLHVNEQDILSLRHVLNSVGFESEVWLANVQLPLTGAGSSMPRFLLRVLLDMYPFRWVFRNDVFAIARKQG